MESRSPGDSVGGGGRDAARTPPSTAGPPGAERRDHDRHDHVDDERPTPALGTPGPQPCPSPGAPAAPTLSLDQIRVVAGRSNEYTDGPTLARKVADPRGPAPPLKDPVVATAAARVSPAPPRADDRATETPAEPSRGPPPPSLCRSSGPSSGGADEESRAPAGCSSHEGSLSSLQRLVGGGGGGGGEETVRTQPKRAEPDGDERKPLTTAAAGAGAGEGPHSPRCSDCGRCGCGECTRPRVLPSCWLCGRRCMCSARGAAEYATCVCCVRGLFYHCSSDDEDTCAEKPFSCTQAHCGARWTAVTLLALLLPCIACWPLAKGCAAACQHCYDAAARPGCRCKGGVQRGGGGGKPT